MLSNYWTTIITIERIFFLLFIFLGILQLDLLEIFSHRKNTLLTQNRLFLSFVVKKVSQSV